MTGLEEYMLRSKAEHRKRAWRGVVWGLNQVPRVVKSWGERNGVLLTPNERYEHNRLRPGKAKCAVLFGDDPKKDWKIMRAHGFKKGNILAVDLDAEKVSAARALGFRAFRGSMEEAIVEQAKFFPLKDAPAGSGFDVVFYDGVSPSANTVWNLFHAGLRMYSVVYANMQRGRETCFPAGFFEDMTRIFGDKHRAHLFGLLSQEWLTTYPGINSDLARAIFNDLPVKIDTYRSERTTMDSVVFVVPPEMARRPGIAANAETLRNREGRVAAAKAVFNRGKA